MMMFPISSLLWLLVFFSYLAEFHSFSPPIFVTTTTTTKPDITITESSSSFPTTTTTTTTTTSSSSCDSSISSSDDDEGESNKQLRRMSWIERVYQLIEFREMHGHTCVPKRYPANPSLGHWVTKQRQSYRKFLLSNDDETPHSCSLTEQQIQVLNDIDFCWDPKKKSSNSSRRDNHDDSLWWNKLNEYRLSLVEDNNNNNNNNNKQKILPWIRQQRQEYNRYVGGEISKLNEDKMLALNDVNPDWWKTARQCQWELRCQELVDYRNQHGDCCVPITYGNKKLANWVSNTRKNYNQILAGKKPSSVLTTDQIEKLNQIGFVWNRWDYEYERKTKRP